VLIRLQDRCEEIAKSPDALEFDLWSEVNRVHIPSIQFFPGEWLGDRGLSRVGTQRVGAAVLRPKLFCASSIFTRPSRCVER
jgi:hypothetical protein